MYRFERIVILLSLLENLLRFHKAVQRVLGCGRGLHNLFGGVDDALRQIAGVRHHPLGGYLADETAAYDHKENYFLHLVLFLGFVTRLYSPPGERVIRSLSLSYVSNMAKPVSMNRFPSCSAT